jgi:hypothetical protein
VTVKGWVKVHCRALILYSLPSVLENLTTSSANLPQNETTVTLASQIAYERHTEAQRSGDAEGEGKAVGCICQLG